MDLQLPPDVTLSLQAFLDEGRYGSEADVLRDALAALRRQQDLAAIAEGAADAAAGRVTPARDTLSAARQRIADQCE
ncbi:MAG: hypothetical protein CMJ58_13685 [Planctomycetaceae bacterium]|nr:hypothetical protein [Planctomycetaceae bacterium]